MNISNHLAMPSEATLPRTWTTVLLSAGVALAPLFLLVAVVQILTRPGFDITRHALSALQNGSYGWVQAGNFVLTGVLAVLFAWGVRKAVRGSRGQTWAPILVGVFGVGMIAAGLFPPDAAFGFPAGVPAGPPDSMSVSGSIHSAGFFVAFAALIASCFVLAGHFRTTASHWRLYSIVVGVVTPMTIALGTALTEVAGIFYLAAGAIAFIWLSAVAARLLSDHLRRDEHD